MAGFRIEGNVSGNVAEVDANNNLKTNLPTVNTQAGFARLTSLIGASTYNDALVTQNGKLYVAPVVQLEELVWNSASTTWANKIGTDATTMTKAVQTNGFMRLNASALTPTTTGISIYSNRVVAIEDGGELRISTRVKTVNAAATNKQIDVGLGYYAFAAGQAAAMNEFVGFRWTTTGGFQGVVETGTGGATTVQTVNLNSNTPFSDNVAHDYRMFIDENAVFFYVDDVYQGQIVKDPASWGVMKGASLPWIARTFNSGAASAACTVDIGAVSIHRGGFNDSIPQSYLASLQGKSSLYFQADLTSAATATHSVPASGTAPTAAVGSNTASAFNNVAVMGGYYRNTLTGVTGTAHTNVLVSGYQNPAVPTASGVATNSRNFIVTSITISPMVVTTALTGGGFTAIWFVAVGNTAVSLATTDADGTTALAQKAPRFFPLSLTSTLAAAAAAGAVSTDVGDHTYVFPTPLVVHPGEFVSVGFRTIVATAVTAGAADGAIAINGYWE